MSVKYLKECVLGIFFLSYLCLGLFLFDDYGVSIDEAHNRKNALINYNISVHNYPSPSLTWSKYHGSAFDFALYLAEKIIRIHPEDHRAQFLYRHLINFLVFFLSVLAFYKLLNGRFNHWGLALLGCCFLILSPRIFADAFYNSKDLAFLSFFILSMATQQWYLAKPRLKSLIAHALVCGICVDIRISGILAPVLTVFLLTAAMVHSPDAGVSRHKRHHLISFMLLTFIFIVMFWPMLWRDPPGEFINAIKYMTQVPYDTPVLFMGKTYSSLDLPWTYVPLWIAISTPPLYLFLFVVGSVVLVSKLIREPQAILRHNSLDLVSLIWFFAPLFLAILANVNFYDGYRHLYFIYPALIYIALTGLYFIFNLESGKLALNRFLRGLLVAAVILNFLAIGKFLIRHHPYQNVYLNFLAGRDAHRQFDLDYWGLAYIKAYQYLLNNVKTDKISIAVPLDDYLLSTAVLTDHERRRLQVCTGGTRYFISNYRIQKYAPYEESALKKLGEEIYLIQTERAKVLGVYELSAKGPDELIQCLSLDKYLSQKHLLGDPVIE